MPFGYAYSKHTGRCGLPSLTMLEYVMRWAGKLGEAGKEERGEIEYKEVRERRAGMMREQSWVEKKRRTTQGMKEKMIKG